MAVALAKTGHQQTFGALPLHQHLQTQAAVQVGVQVVANAAHGRQCGGQHQSAPANAPSRVQHQPSHIERVLTLSGRAHVFGHVKRRLLRVVERALHTQGTGRAQPAGAGEPAQAGVITQCGRGEHPGPSTWPGVWTWACGGSCHSGRVSPLFAFGHRCGLGRRGQLQKSFGHVQRGLHHAQTGRNFGPSHAIVGCTALELRAQLQQAAAAFEQAHEVGGQFGHLVQPLRQGLQRLCHALQAIGPGCSVQALRCAFAPAQAVGTALRPGGEPPVACSGFQPVAQALPVHQAARQRQPGAQRIARQLQQLRG